MIRRALRPPRALAILAALALGAGGLGAADVDEDRPAKAAGVQEPDVVATGETVADEERPTHASDYPPGVTLLAPRVAAALTASMFPPGVTVLGPARPRDAAPGRAAVRVGVERRRPPRSADATRLPAADDAVERAMAPPPPVDSPGTATAGPPKSEQLAAFGDPVAIPGAAPAAYEWVPSPAWPERDDPSPYPWQPARFADPVIDPVWTPTSSWPPRESDDAYPWQPARWSASTFDTSWTPRDAWGRTLVVSPAQLDATIARRGAQPDAEPANATPRGAPPAEAEPAAPPAR